MADILARIEAYKRREIAAAKEATPPAAMRARAEAAAPPRDFAGALAAKRAAGQFALIARSRRRARPRA